MSFKQKVLIFSSELLKKTIRIFGKRRESQILAFLTEYLPPYVTQKTKFGKIVFFCPGVIPEWRAHTLLTKEPETIEWIDSFKGISKN